MKAICPQPSHTFLPFTPPQQVRRATALTLIFPKGALGLGRILKNGGKELITTVVMGSTQAHSQFPFFSFQW